MRLKLAAAAWDYTAEIVRDISVTVANGGSRREHTESNRCLLRVFVASRAWPSQWG